MRGALRSIWREMLAPSEHSETPYTAFLIAIGHAVLGAALASPAPLLLVATAAIARLVLPAACRIVKERGDLRRGGRMRDGLIDTVMAGIGTAFYGHALWPAAILVAALAAAVIAQIRRP